MKNAPKTRTSAQRYNNRVDKIWAFYHKDRNECIEIAQAMWPDNTMTEEEKATEGRLFINKHFEGHRDKAYAEIVTKH